jgi:glycosyltransferase involved in cell wall biosynthesis
MRIGISGVFWGLEGTGSGQYLHSLLHAMTALAPEHDYRLYLPATCRAEMAKAAATPVSLSTPWDWRSSDLAKLWFEQLALPRACRRDSVDLLHVPYFAPVRWGGPVPVVVTIHDLIPLILPAYRGSYWVRAYTRLVCAAARRARLVLTDSQASARDIERLLQIPRSRVRVVYLAADDRYRPPDQASVSQLRQRLGLPSRYMLYLGGFDRRKNLPELLQAYALARARLDGLALVVAGRLPAKDTLFTPDPQRIARNLGLGDAVRFTGWVDEADKPALYGGATAFLFPSRYEGFGLPVLEAICCGVPAIVAGGSSLGEVAGEAGMVVPAGDVGALAQALVRIACDGAVRAQLAAACAPQAARFSSHEMARQTVAAYAEALS